MQWAPFWGHVIQLLLSPWRQTGVTSGVPVVSDRLMETRLRLSSGP